MKTLAFLDNEAAVLLDLLKDMLEKLNREGCSERWSSVRQAIETQYSNTSRYRERLPKSFEAMSLIAEIRDIDERFANANVDPGFTGCVLWLKLNKNESYDDFKLIIGKLLKRGWTIGSGKTDNQYGSVDWSLYKQHAYLTLYVAPGDSETCRIVETEELRPVVIKKIVCNDQVIGEMPTAKLVNPTLPIGDDHAAIISSPAS